LLLEEIIEDKGFLLPVFERLSHDMKGENSVLSLHYHLLSGTATPDTIDETYSPFSEDILKIILSYSVHMASTDESFFSLALYCLAKLAYKD